MTTGVGRPDALQLKVTASFSSMVMSLLVNRSMICGGSKIKGRMKEQTKLIFHNDITASQQVHDLWDSESKEGIE